MRVDRWSSFKIRENPLCAREEAEVESVWKCSFIEEKARSQEVMNNNFFMGFIGK